MPSHVPRCAVLLWLVWLAGTASAQPSLSRMVPTGLVPGKTIEVTLHGAKLAPPLQVWSSFGAKIELEQPAKEAAQVKAKITVDAGESLGVGGLVIGNAAGASVPLLVMLDDMPAAVDNGKNHSLETAQKLTSPLAVDGVADGSMLDFYRLTLAKDQRIAVEIFASRLDSALDPVVRLLDVGGQELLAVDDDPRLGADCRFEWTAPAAADYLLEVADNRFQAGGHYRLRVGDFPLITTAYPLGARLGSTNRLEFLSARGESLTGTLSTAPHQAPNGCLPMGVRVGASKSSALVTLAASHWPERQEQEPNDELKSATRLTIPCGVSGILGSSSDLDYYEFAVTKGSRFRFRVSSRSLGSPAYPYLQLQDAAGKSLAESNFTEVGEPVLEHAFAADGVYRLRVDDLQHQGGPDHAYRVSIEPAPAFELSLKNDKNSVTHWNTSASGGVVTFDLQVARKSYQGPIQLVADGADDLLISPEVIPAKATAVKVQMTPRPGARVGGLAVFRLQGEAEIDGRLVRETMATADVVRAKRARLSYPPAWLDGILTASTTAAATPFFTTRLEPSELFLSRTVGKVGFTLHPQRTNKDFKAALVVRLENLPEGVRYVVKKEGEGAEEKYQIELTAQNAPRCLAMVEVAATGILGAGGHVVRSQIPLHVFDPITVTADPIAAVAPGQMTTLRVRLRQEGPDKQPVKLRVLGLPAGVTANPEYELPLDPANMTIQLLADKTAAAGKHQLTVEAESTYQGQPVKTRVAQPVWLEIAKPPEPKKAAPAAAAKK